MGFISLKFSIKGTGLINVSGFHVDPGYEGRLIFSVYNAAPTAITMTRGQDLFLLWLADLDRSSVTPFIKTPAKQIPSGIPEDMVSRANHPIRSMQQLSEKVDDLNKEVTRIRDVGKFVISLIAIIAAVIGAIRFFGESPVVNEPSENATDQLNGQVESQINGGPDVTAPGNANVPQSHRIK